MKLLNCLDEKCLEDLGEKQEDETKIMEDNQGVLVWGVDGIRHSKQISIKMKFVKEYVDREVLQLIYCPTNAMVADVLTKPLLRQNFEKNRAALGVMPLEK